MTELDLKRYLYSIHENNKLIGFSLEAFKKIISFAGSWQPVWTRIFEQILDDMVKGKGYHDNNRNNKNGMYVSLPISIFTKDWIAVFFRPPQPYDGTYLIYDFEIVPK